MSTSTTKAGPAHPALQFGVKLAFYLANLPDHARRTSGQARWSQDECAYRVGVSSKTIGRWVRGEVAPDGTNLGLLETALFGSDLEQHIAEREELRALARLGRFNADNPERSSAGRVQLLRKRVVADQTEDLPTLTYDEIDHLPADEPWTFDEIRYGEGAQIVSVPGSDLFYLPAGARLLDARGNLRPLTGYFPEDRAELDALATEKEIFFPRRVTVSGIKRAEETVKLFACTNQSYDGGVDARNAETFSAEAFLGLGGLAAFLDRQGEFVPRTDIYLGGNLSCVVVLVAVAYLDRRPICRSPYCLTIRKGIRYPDDVWLSPVTGRPKFSGPDPVTARFLFQSRESKGESTDMFAANFNGTVLVNLNATDWSAWDGFQDEDGNDCVSWDGRRVTFASMVNGNGFIERITREDAS